MFVDPTVENAERLLTALRQFFGGAHLGLDDLIRSEEAADRPQDRADLAVLRKARSRRDDGGARPPHS